MILIYDFQFFQNVHGCLQLHQLSGEQGADPADPQRAQHQGEEVERRHQQAQGEVVTTRGGEEDAGDRSQQVR